MTVNGIFRLTFHDCSVHGALGFVKTETIFLSSDHRELTTHFPFILGSYGSTNMIMYMPFLKFQQFCDCTYSYKHSTLRLLETKSVCLTYYLE